MAPLVAKKYKKSKISYTVKSQLSHLYPAFLQQLNNGRKRFSSDSMLGDFDKSGAYRQANTFFSNQKKK
ncbi:hypothetical protein BpHYR1_019445 [Brachionus plicatilis]|uniref:Uncharacterized protein n=1 Tax=Brachionus plicatilis TaxID=10195 RepID=A0A3M7RD03_BRAPC|nr:hypothetical protein BpHYR1_019445 [Brachionus plicatilis]